MGLRTLLLNGEFPANARLPETALAKRLGISRTPLRQAMARLVDEGLLERVETGGCRVATFSMNDIIDAIEIRGVIEGTAARLAAERGIGPDRIQQGHDILAKLDEAVSISFKLDFERFVTGNAEFHAFVAASANSPLLLREIDRIYCLPLASPSAFLKGQEAIPDFHASTRLAQDQHRLILEAIENREGARAEALMREHARLAHKNLKYITEENPSLADRVPGLALVAN